jgi:hypothetical protein
MPVCRALMSLSWETKTSHGTTSCATGSHHTQRNSLKTSLHLKYNKGDAHVYVHYVLQRTGKVRGPIYWRARWLTGYFRDMNPRPRALQATIIPLHQRPKDFKTCCTERGSVSLQLQQ